MYKKKIMKMCLAGALAISMVSVNTMPAIAAEKEVQAEEAVTMNIRFMEGDTFISGGDYSLTEGVHNYTELQQYAPEGYIITTTGDFMVTKGGKLDVNVVKAATMNIRFMEGDTFIAGGDYLVPEGVNNYSVLQQYVPEGYEMTETGDFMAEDSAKLEVNVEKIQKEVTMNIRFLENGTFVSGGDYTLLEGIHNYSDLEQYVPEGYQMTASGDFMAEEGAKLEVNVEKIQKEVTMNIRFMENGTFISGGDYTFLEGIHNYSDLEQYVPEGYQMTTSGDFTAAEGAKLVVNVEKVKKDVIVNIVFMENGTFISGGDYTLLEGVHNYSDLEQYVPEGYQMTVSGDFYVEERAKLTVNVAKIRKDVTMNIRFMDDETFVAGGDYSVPEGVNNYSVLEQYVPEEYTIVVSGDFMAAEGGKLDVSVKKVADVTIKFMNGDEVISDDVYKLPVNTNSYADLKQYVPEGYVLTSDGEFDITSDKVVEVNVAKSAKDVKMNIRFMDGDNFVAGGDYFVPEGVNNYSVLEQYVPEGYEMTVSGDFYGEENGKLEVSIKKEVKDVIMNIRFMDGDNFVAGGDYSVPNGVNNYSILEQYVPEGYQMTVSGDFMAEEGAKLIVNIEKINKEVIMNIRFMDGDTFIAGGDYFVPEGVNNYSVLEQYVPEGYQMTVSGDFMGEAGAKLDVNVEKINKEVIMNIRFMDGDTFIAGGDYFVPKGVNNYSVLDQYVPEGYKIAVSGDFMAKEGASLDVRIEKLQKESIINVQFVYNGQVLAGGDYFVDSDGDGIFKYKELEEYVPEGYKMAVTGTAKVEDSPFVIELIKEGGEVGNLPDVDLKEGWYKVGDSDWSYYIAGQKVVSDWVSVEEADPYNNNEVGTVWYHMNSEGLMDRGWIVDESGWKVYLLDSNGRMMHSQWVNAPASEELNRPAGLYKLTDDGAVQMNGWAESVTPGIYWFCNAGTGLFEVDNPASWGSEKLF